MHSRMEAAVTLGHLGQLHPVTQRILASLAIVSGLTQVDVALGRDEADEALVTDHVATLGVRVDQAFFLPLAQALVFAFCKRIKRKKNF